MSRRPPRGWLTLAALALVVGCATSDLQLVANAKAAIEYHAPRYMRECVTAIPISTRSCLAFRQALTEAEQDFEVANAAQKLGKLPSSARKRMKAIPKELEAK